MYDYYKDIIKRLETYKWTECIDGVRCDFVHVSTSLRNLMKMEFEANLVPKKILKTIESLESVLIISKQQFELTIDTVIEEINKFILENEDKSNTKQLTFNELKDLEISLSEVSFDGYEIKIKCVNSNTQYTVFPSGQLEYPFLVIKRNLVKDGN